VLAFQHFENMLSQVFIDFIMPGNGLRNVCFGISVPVMLAAMADKFATN